MTLSELNTSIESKITTWRNAVADAKTKLEGAKTSLATAQDSLNEAVNEGDQEAYRTAYADVNYYTAVIEKMEADEKTPPYTPDEHEAIKEEIRLSHATEVIPLYKEVLGALDSGLEILDRIEELNRLHNSVMNTVDSSIPAELRPIGGPYSCGMITDVKSIPEDISYPFSMESKANFRTPRGRINAVMEGLKNIVARNSKD